MTTEAGPSDSSTRKRQRRVKQDPEFVFGNSTAAVTKIESKSVISAKQKTKPAKSTDESAVGADLYEPGDLVWSKLGSFPWWPALIYRCQAEGGIHTRTFNSNNQPKRQFFVYFYGKYLEYAWLSTRSLLPYAGLNSFIQHAEAAVEKAATKSEQVQLANRYQLKVSMKKRIQWDEAIELADHALSLTKAERIEEFSSLLSETSNQSKKGIRRRIQSVDKSEDDPVSPKKRPARAAAASSSSDGLTSKRSDTTTPSVARKSSRKPTSAREKNTTSSTDHADQSVEAEVNGSAAVSEKTEVSSDMKLRNQRASNNDSDVEYEYVPLTKASSEPAILPPQLHFLQMNIPPLSNYEQKQIVEGLLNHQQAVSLTFDEAQTFASKKATEIIHENYNYRMEHLSKEWFYDLILLRHPTVVFKYRSWFEHIPTDVIPDGTDPIQLKQWLIALMLQAEQKSLTNAEK